MCKYVSWSKFNLSVIFSLVMLAFLSSWVFADSGRNWTINPGVNVGEITKSTTEKDLIRIYGKKNVKRSEIYVGEGEVVLGTILYPETNKQIEIEWKKDFSKPGRITISEINSVWQLNSGIKVGSTLDEVEKINKGPFKITGFEWDYPGRTASWENGELATELQLEFDYHVDIGEDVSQSEFLQVLGDGYFSSKNRVIQKMNLTVKTIFIRWDI